MVCVSVQGDNPCVLNECITACTKPYNILSVVYCTFMRWQTLRVCNEKYFFLFLTKTYVVDTQKNDSFEHHTQMLN